LNSEAKEDEDENFEEDLDSGDARDGSDRLWWLR
jgi:hypothetical protein